MYWVCENFYAVITEQTSEGGTKKLFECTNGPEKAFKNNEYARVDGDLDCIYNMTRTSGEGVTLNFTETARCGFNKNNKFYCPKRRGATEFIKENAADRITWALAPNTCHHRTSILYCKDILDNIRRSVGFRNFLRTEWMTTIDNWPLVANSDKRVTNAIAFTRYYWMLSERPSNTISS
jgi:hypothetical protein